MRFVSINEKQTRDFGKKIAHDLLPGDCLFLYGDVGAGKTVFIKGIARGLKIKEIVTSPSFTIINEYAGRIPLYHVDLYRVKSADIFYLGLDEYVNKKDHVTAIEWADGLNKNMADRTWEISLKRTTNNKRIITVRCSQISRKKRNLKK